MRIVIVGAGKVGHTLAEQLSFEGHDIVIIDKSQQIIDSLVNALDVLGIVGNGASYGVLKEAEVDRADLLIACTSHDEVNLLCCMAAKKIGAESTIARVRNPEYNDQLLFMREELGLSMSINPEYISAMELFRILQFPSAIKIESFSNKRVEIAEIKLKEDSKLAGMKIGNLRSHFKEKVLICSVQRGSEVAIPGGSFVLQAGDKINILATRNEMAGFFSAIDLLQKQANDIMIIGGGRISYYLSRMLLDNGMRVKIIDIDKTRCLELCQLLPKAAVICGDGTEQDLLQEEGISDVDAIITMTGVDEENIILSMYAQTVTTGKVITKISRPALVKLVENTNLDTIVSPRVLTANLIVRYVRAKQNSVGSNIETLHRLVGGAVEAIEFKVNETFPKAGVRLKDLSLRPNILIGCIGRSGKTIIPGGDDSICPGDRVIIITTNEQLDDLSDILL